MQIDIYAKSADLEKQLFDLYEQATGSAAERLALTDTIKTIEQLLAVRQYKNYRGKHLFDTGKKGKA